MNRIIKIALVVVAIVAIFTIVITLIPQKQEIKTTRSAPVQKPSLANETPELIMALVADSHNFNDNLQKALKIAKENKVDFVIHLGDLSTVGTAEELTKAKKILDESGLSYYVLPGDHEYYVSEWNGSPSINNFTKVFGEVPDAFVLSWDNKNSKLEALNSKQIINSKFKIQNKEKYLFIHEPLYPLGKDSEMLESVRESNIKVVVAGDAHFSSETADPVRSSLKHIVIGALTEERNLQTPRFSLLKVYEDGSYNVEEIVLANQKLEGGK